VLSAAGPLFCWAASDRHTMASALMLLLPDHDQVQSNAVRCVLCCAVLCWCAGTPLGLMQDSSSGAIHLWSGEALHDVSLSNEGKDMWRTYLEYQVGEEGWQGGSLVACAMPRVLCCWRSRL